MSEATQKSTRWERFRRIPSLKRLVIFSVFMMIGMFSTIVAGSIAIQLFVPSMGEASIHWPGSHKEFGAGERHGGTVFHDRKRVNLLVLGIDYNHDSKGIIYTKGARSDTMMVVSMGAEAELLNVVSIPRDMYVPISESLGYEKINAAFSYGGIKQAKQTVENFLGVPIQYYVIVKVDGAKKVIDALGGLRIDVEKDMDYDDNWGQLHIHLKKGPQLLTGDQVVGYARFRHDEESDRGRIRRQQQVIRTLLKKLKDPSTITKLPQIAKAVKEMLETDLELNQMVDLALLYKDFNPTKMRSGQIIGDDDTVNGAMVLVPYEPENSKLVRRLLKDNIDLGLRDLRIRVLNGTNEPNLGSLLADEMNLEGFNVVKVDDAPNKGKVQQTEIIEHIKTPRGHARLQNLFPEAKFRDSAGGNGEYDITIVVGTDRGFLTSRPVPESASRWDQPESSYPRYREPEPTYRPAPPPEAEPEPEPEPEQAPEPEPVAAPEPPPAASEPAAPAPQPVAPAPAPAPVAPPVAAPAPAPVEIPVAPPPAPAPEAPAPSPING